MTHFCLRAATSSAPPTTNPWLQGIQLGDGYCPQNTTVAATTAECAAICASTTSLPGPAFPNILCVAGMPCNVFAFAASDTSCYLGYLGNQTCNFFTLSGFEGGCVVLE